ncbi:2-oxo-4-hydroxy-4-carboxy-5-ureidoimidazoline decarboxylase [Streptomyces sp. NBC_01803]|uniref:2-oxo-4-hydroxy-4-carboxy-5-ureidoimidazoline decarboxylase n=1 Tax=Streptomyces sp. NBC_01803 TaxID=2975946 RepID=UPI002DDBD1EE|nr:2-oxo-4-hydroxy-4-carboxy-5-ureidoimidazoline decarboxylase [Streptomyces sp. NBC_01803]WSA43739.1 2-oxo-4-hydroxy-4-carboxy-5-ureidoimidazoline decarboxylase [Streptomyces sp. NBC_01803]
MTRSPAPGLAWLNGADERAARDALRHVCAARAWRDGLLAARPFADTEALLAASDAATTGLTADDLAEAMAGHPPIGRPDPADPASAREQRGMADAPDALRAEMLDLNLAYQERFGHVFLIRATGLSGERMLAALRARMDNPPDAEREIVRVELGKINRLRLTRLAEATATVSTHILDTSAGRPAPGVAVTLSALPVPAGGTVEADGADGADGAWTALGTSRTDADGRCKDLPALPGGAAAARLTFAVEPYLSRTGTAPAFFPEVTVAFAVVPGEHYHVPLLLNPYGYSVYRGS